MVDNSNRIDHRVRLGTAGAAQEETPDGLVVGLDLIDYLDKAFPRSPPVLAASLDQAVARTSVEAYEAGVMAVLTKLRSLIPTAKD